MSAEDRGKEIHDRIETAGKAALDTPKRRLPDWTIPAAFFAVAILIAVALWAVGDGSSDGDHASEVAGATRLLREEQKWLDYGAEGMELARQGQRECAEAVYLCDTVAALNEETGTAKMEKSAEQVERIRSALRSLDPAAVEEAER